MALFLVEANLDKTLTTKEAVQQKIEEYQAELSKNNIDFVEVQIASDFSKGFFIFEATGEARGEEELTSTLANLGLTVSLVKAVRLIGEEVEEVKQQKGKVNYLVEWNLPEHLTMDQYLERKKANSVHYAEVPEVSFARTYVCEDMTKCLCFYDAPNAAAVKKAREAVKAPIDALTEIVPE